MKNPFCNRGEILHDKLNNVKEKFLASYTKYLDKMSFSSYDDEQVLAGCPEKVQNHPKWKGYQMFFMILYIHNCALSNHFCKDALLSFMYSTFLPLGSAHIL